MDERTVAAVAESLQARVQAGHTGEVESNETESVAFEGIDDAVASALRTRLDDDLTRYSKFDTWPEDEPLPEWVSVASELVSYLETVESPTSIPDALRYEFPFVEFFYHVFEFSVDEFLDDDLERLSEEARGDFRENLLERLADVGAQALHLDFLYYLDETDPDALRADRRDPDSRERYEAYVVELFDGRIGDVFERFPILAKRTVEGPRQWATYCSRFTARLDNDYHALCSLYDAAELGDVTRVVPGAGDRHHGGKTVLVAEFESGDEVVYKPRNVEAEKQLYDFESWLGRRFDEFPELQVPDLLSRDTYGWVTRVEPGEFSNVEHLERYYHRAGALLCVLYLLNATDCHSDNVIAGEVSPVVVDAETIVQTDVSIGEIPRSERNTKLQLGTVQDSVLKTLMLPFYTAENESTQAGLEVVEEYEADISTVTWTDVNTDAIDIEYRRRTITAEDNVPVYDGEPAPPELFADEIVSGFGVAYDVIRDARRTVVDEVTNRFAGLRVRNVLKETALYQALLNTLSTPEYLRDGVKHSCKVHETLSRTLSGGPLLSDADCEDAVVDAERKALSNGDVPRFSMWTDEHGLYHGDEVVSSAMFDTTGIERVRNRIEGMSDEDRTYQQGLIRACFGRTNAPNEESSERE